MKPMLLTIALIGFTAIGGYAQNIDCNCKKIVHHKTTKHETTQPKVTTSCKPVADDNWERTYSFVKGTVEPCSQYRKHNIVVTECPGSFYDNSGIKGYETESSYMGYYPRPEGMEQLNGPMAPQHTTIDNYKGIAPAGANACNADCAPR